MRFKNQCFMGLLAIFVYPSMVMAAELKVMSAGAVEPGIEIALHQFEKSSGHRVQLQFGTGPQLKERLASGQAFDVLIAPNALIDEQLTQGVLKAGETIDVGKVGAGVAVRKGATIPAIRTVEELKKTLLSADTVVYNKASTGIYLDKLFSKIGISEAIQAKTTRYDNGESVLMHVIKGRGNEIGFGAITEIKLFESKGLQYVGPLPSDVQNYTSYSAGVMTSSANAELARAFLKNITHARSSGDFQKVGIE